MDAAIEFPRLETDKLILRKITLEDAEALFNIWADDEVTKYTVIESLTSIEQAENIIKQMDERFKKKEGIRWGIIRKKDNILVGTCGYNSWIRILGCRGEIGYDVGREYWGQGIMKEALQAVIRYGFEIMKLNRIEALVILDASRSLNLLCKLGFQMEGILREYGYWKGRFWDNVCFSLLKREWILNQNYGIKRAV